MELLENRTYLRIIFYDEKIIKIGEVKMSYQKAITFILISQIYILQIHSYTVMYIEQFYMLYN